MRILPAVVAILCVPAAAATVNVEKCNAYLLAPRGYRKATVDLLSSGISKNVQQQRRDLVSMYILDKAPLGSDRVIEYLRGLAGESAQDAVYEWAMALQNHYLMRTGNQVFAERYLNEFLDAFWNDVIFGGGGSANGRLQQSFTWSDEQLKFVKGLAQKYPRSVEKAWTALFGRYIPEIIDLPEVTADMQQVVKYLEVYARQSDAEIAEDDAFYKEGENVDNLVENRRRVEDAQKLLQELNYTLPDQNFESFLRLYTLPESVHLIGSDSWRGDSVFRESAVRTLTFIWRLARDMNLASPPQLRAFREVMDQIQKQLQNYPRKSAGVSWPVTG